MPITINRNIGSSTFMQNPEKYDKRASKFRKISDLNRRLRQGPP